MTLTQKQVERVTEIARNRGACDLDCKGCPLHAGTKGELLCDYDTTSAAAHLIALGWLSVQKKEEKMKENNSFGFWVMIACLFLLALLFLSLGHDHVAYGQESDEDGVAWSYYQPDDGGGQPDDGYQPDEGSYQPPEGEDESYQPPGDNDSDGYDGYYND